MTQKPLPMTRLVGHAAIQSAYENLFERCGVHIRTRQLHVNGSGDLGQEMHILTQITTYLKAPKDRIAICLYRAWPGTGRHSGDKPIVLTLRHLLARKI